MELRASHIIDNEIEGHFAFFPFAEQISTREHQHDFYEMFLIAKGAIQHHVNGKTQSLSQGSLVLIRPLDAHYFSKSGDDNCELLNIAFFQYTFENLTHYLDRAHCERDLLNPYLPPSISLTRPETQITLRKLKRWGQHLYQQKNISRMTLRGLLAELMSTYFLNDKQRIEHAMPDWLGQVCDEMAHKHNLIEGREALMRLAQRSPEYVGRMFQTYLKITPSQFINNLRLDYASELLLQTKQSPTDIAYDVGFGNLSHFYHLFKKRWHCSPLQFRKQHQQILIP